MSEEHIFALLLFNTYEKALLYRNAKCIIVFLICITILGFEK